MVLSAITIQYLLNVEQTIIEWIWINILFESIGESKAAAVAYATVGPSWSYLLTNINAFLLLYVTRKLSHPGSWQIINLYEFYIDPRNYFCKYPKPNTNLSILCDWNFGFQNRY